MSVQRLAWLLVVMATGIPAAAGAQTGDDLIGRAVRAYAEVDWDGTVGFLRRWLASDPAARAPTEQRRRALTYLGAAEVLRSNFDSAAAAFERLIELDPRARLDELVFPPEVTNRFELVRFRTKVVSIKAPPVTELRLGGTPYLVQVLASSAHELRIALRRPEAGPLRTIYAGLIGDSMEVSWDGRDSVGALVPSGMYLLEAFSHAPGGSPQRVLQVPLDITAQAPDTLPAPVPLAGSLLLPERRGAGAGIESLLGAVLAGVGIGLLPPLLAEQVDVKPWRWAVAGTIGIAGLVGFVRDRPGGTVTANRLANDALRRQWQQRAAQVAELNRARRAAANLIIRFGPPVLIRLSGR